MASGRYDDLLFVPKIPREDCLRIGAQEAKEQGLGVSSFRNASGFHLLCHCPECGQRARYLYRPPIVKAWHRYTPRETLPHADNWACARCHGLIFASSQRSGTVATMRAARERDRQEWKRLYPDGDVSFEAFQKWRHRSYNRKKARNRFQFGKIA